VSGERIFYDGINALKLPRIVAGVLGYDNGPISKWQPQWWNLFGPNVVKGHISVFASDDTGQILDVEQGDATPAESVDWVLKRRKAGVDPTVYMNMSTWPEVRAAFRARKVMEPHYWVAQYDNVRQIPSGAIAKQFYNNDALGYDMSIVVDFWPGVDPAPVVRPVSGTPSWPGYDFVYDPKKPVRYDHNVQVWQQRMRDRGWHIQADGQYGPISQGICEEFQQDSTNHNWPLKKDGIVGVNTWRATWERPVSK
jgi:hypothetical protein